MNVLIRRRVVHPVLWTLVAIVAVVIVVSAYFILGPSPTDFAGGRHVGLDKYTEADPSGVPIELKSASLIEQGEYLTHAADCAACHTAKDGQPFAGGRAFVLPFGTIYSTNITPDVETGIGSYSEANFLDAVHKGIGRGNIRLYPAMPYASYTSMSDADALAIKAYLFSLKPIHAAALKNTLTFPFNQRGLMRVWAAMFNSNKRYEANVDRSAEWNRGAYMVEAMGHCGECHTPRNIFFALNNRQKFAGAVQAGWRAYNITPDRSSGVGAWSEADLLQYLSIGHADGRGTAAGPMGEAVDFSLRHLTLGDVKAMVTYLHSVRGAPASDLPEPRASLAALQADSAPKLPRGQEVYEGACAGCHGWSGVSPVIPLAILTGTRAINDPTATNVVQIIIRGAQRHLPSGAENMPEFGSAYSDAEIASVANYVTARFGTTGSQLTPERVAKLRSEE